MNNKTRKIKKKIIGGRTSEEVTNLIETLNDYEPDTTHLTNQLAKITTNYNKNPITKKIEKGWEDKKKEIDKHIKTVNYEASEVNDIYKEKKKYIEDYLKANPTEIKLYNVNRYNYNQQLESFYDRLQGRIKRYEHLKSVKSITPDSITTIVKNEDSKNNIEHNEGPIIGKTNQVISSIPQSPPRSASSSPRSASSTPRSASLSPRSASPPRSASSRSSTRESRPSTPQSQLNKQQTKRVETDSLNYAEQNNHTSDKTHLDKLSNLKSILLNDSTRDLNKDTQNANSASHTIAQENKPVASDPNHTAIVAAMSAAVASSFASHADEEAENLRLAEEAEKKRLAEEAEKKRLAEEAEKLRLAEEAEKKRLADEAEKLKLAEEAENKRLADEAEKLRLAEEAEKKRLAEEAEKLRLAEEAEKKRLAEEAEKLKLAEEAENKRLADEAEKLRLAEEAEKKRLAEEAEKLSLADEAEKLRLAEEANKQEKRDTSLVAAAISAAAASADTHESSAPPADNPEKSASDPNNAALVAAHAAIAATFAESNEKFCIYMSTFIINNGILKLVDNGIEKITISVIDSKINTTKSEMYNQATQTHCILIEAFTGSNGHITDFSKYNKLLPYKTKFNKLFFYKDNQNVQLLNHH